MDQIKPAARASGWTVLDYDFPFEVQAVPPDALQRWLTREHTLLAHKGKLKAISRFHGPKTTDGDRPCQWVNVLEEIPWILCDDGQRRKPADVLLHPDLDFEDAPVAHIDRDLANRLEREGIRFGADISLSPVLRRLETRGSLDLPDIELVVLLEEALAEVVKGTVTRDELTLALHSVRLRGAPLLRRVVREVGVGTRSDLGGWVVALSSVERALADAVDRVEIDIPKTTTGYQALAFLSETWTCKPQAVDEIRAHIAAAYRYVLEDIDRDELDNGTWNDAKREARLYGKGRWHEISDTLVVDDVRSPFIRQLLRDNRIAITAAHLGDTPAQVRLVATELGIPRLSTKIKVSKGQECAQSQWMGNLQRLVTALATLEGRSAVDRISCCEHLVLQVEGENHDVTAYLVNGELMVAGSPGAFGIQAAEQLVEHFQLGQRGNSIPWLTATVCSLAEDEPFAENLKVLASGLRLSLPDSSIRDAESDAGGVPSNGRDDSEIRDTTGPDAGDKNIRNGGDGSNKDASQDAGQSAPDSRPAADQVAIIISRSRRGKEGSGAATEPTKTPGSRLGPHDDKKARAAAIEFERRHGRQASEMPPGQPGYDIRSFDRVAGCHRHIEVKGVKGDFAQDASVVLTARQMEDALNPEKDDVEYWLYVVDRTQTDKPRVFPIPWMRHRSRLRYGFRADMWAKYAVRTHEDR